MTRRIGARVGVAVAAAALIVASAALWAVRGGDSARPVATQAAKPSPDLLLLTSLPLMFSEELSIDANGSPALTALQGAYRVVPISTAAPAELSKGRLLLMAHPPAQAAENLVALDRWVREGGRVLLLADPLLEWPSERPLGDVLRPPPTFSDTGLLGHWGLRLDAPDERGPTLRGLGEFEVETNSPGRLAGGCSLSQDGFVARCSIGKGHATVVADADFLNVNDLDGPTDHNLDGLLAELAMLGRK